MAAAIGTLNDYLLNVIRITDGNIRQAVNDQGLVAFDDFFNLTESDVEEICSNVRKPGGMMVNPNVQVLNLPGVPMMIANPGLPLGHLFEKRLKMLRYYMFHLKRIQRLPINLVQATLADITSVYVLKESDKNEGTVDLPSQFQKIDNARVILEDLDDYLLRKRGEFGVPLSYITRFEVALPPMYEDPGFGQPNYVEEMIRRAPHVGPEWQIDNVAVWNVIRHVTHDGPAWNWVSRFARTGNGRDAYLALKTHFLGESYQERIRAQADARLDNAFFDGRNRNFTYESYCGLLNNAFADIESTGERLDESRKLRYFMRGLKDPLLEAAKAQIIASQGTGRATFEGAVNFVGQFLDQRRSLDATNNSRSISSATTGGRGGRSQTGRGRGGRTFGRGGRGRGGRGGRGRNGNNPNRYLSDTEWSALSMEERQRLRDRRAAHTQGGRTTTSNTVADTRSVRQRTNPVSDNASVGTSLTAQPSVAPTIPNSIYQNNVGAVMSRRQTGQAQQQALFFE